ARRNPYCRLRHPCAAGQRRPGHRRRQAAAAPGRGGTGMSPLIRQHRYALGVTLRRLLAQPFSSIANILVIMLALAIPLLGATALMSLRPVANHLAADPEMTVFMQVDATPAETGAVADRIRRDHAS